MQRVTKGCSLDSINQQRSSESSVPLVCLRLLIKHGERENDESSVPEDIVSDSDPALPRWPTRRRKPPGRYGFNLQLEWGRL